MDEPSIRRIKDALDQAMSGVHDSSRWYDGETREYTDDGKTYWQMISAAIDEADSEIKRLRAEVSQLKSERPT